MSANQRKNKNKKKNKTKEENSTDCHSTGSAVIHHTEQPTLLVTSLQCEVLFQGRKGSATNSNKVYMCAGDMRSLGIHTGSFVHIHINPSTAENTTNILSTPKINNDFDLDIGIDINSNPDSSSNSKQIIAQVWPSAELRKNAVSLTRFWQPSFPDDLRRDVIISRTRPFFAVHQCSVATFAIHSSHPSFSYEEIVTSSAFRRYFAAALCEAVLCIENSFVLSWRGELITIKVTTTLCYAVLYYTIPCCTISYTVL